MISLHHQYKINRNHHYVDKYMDFSFTFQQISDGFAGAWARFHQSFCRRDTDCHYTQYKKAVYKPIHPLKDSLISHYEYTLEKFAK